LTKSSGYSGQYRIPSFMLPEMLDQIPPTAVGVVLSWSSKRQALRIRAKPGIYLAIVENTESTKE